MDSKVIVAIVCVIAVAGGAGGAFILMSNQGGNDTPVTPGGDTDLGDVITKSELQSVQSKAASDSTTVLKMSNDTAAVQFDSTAILALQSAATFKTSIVDNSTLSDADRAVVGDMPVYEISFGKNKDLGEGKATISVPYVPIDGEDTSKIYVGCIVDGAVESFEATYSDGMVTFTTSHFSLFAILSNQSFTIKFVDDDVVVATETVNYGAIIPAPDYTPALGEGEHFCGWVGLTKTTTAVADATFDIFISTSSAAEDAADFTYEGSFGEFEIVSGSGDASASVSCDNTFSKVPQNVISWEVLPEEYAIARFNEISDAIKNADELMGCTPVEVSVSGYDDIVAYKVDASGTYTLTMLYFAIRNGEQIVYAAALDSSKTLDKFSGIITDGAIAEDSEVKAVLEAALESVGVGGGIQTGNANLCATTFAKYYNGVFEGLVIDQFTPAYSSVTGNGTISWSVNSDAAGLYETYLNAIIASGAEKVDISGYENASMYTKTVDDALKVYFIAYTDDMFITSTDGSASTAPSASGATAEDGMILFNAALKYLGLKIYVPVEPGEASLAVSAEWFLENYEEPYEQSTWTVRDGSKSTSAAIDLAVTLSNGRPGHGQILLTKEDDIDSAYSTAVSKLQTYVGKTGGMGTTFKAFTYEYDGITFSSVGYTVSTSIAIKFVMKVGDVLVDATSPGESEWTNSSGKTSTYQDYIYLRAPSAQQEAFLESFLRLLQSAIEEHGGGSPVVDVDVGKAAEGLAAVWSDTYGDMTANGESKAMPVSTLTVTESESTSATIKYTYANKNGAERNEYIFVSYENDIASAYNDAKVDLHEFENTIALGSESAGCYYRALTGEIDGVEYYGIMYTKNNSGIGCLRFVTYVDNILIDASMVKGTQDGYPYIFLNYKQDHYEAAYTLIEAFHDWFGENSSTTQD